MSETDLADRVRSALGTLSISEKKMFGGVSFMLNGNMLVGASPRGLMVRVGKEGNRAALMRPHARPMEQKGRPMAGYVVVAPEGVADDADLRAWLDLAIRFVTTLPFKPVAAGRPARSATAGR